MSILKIFITYVKIGFMAFGGGYVMLPLIESQFVMKQKTISAEEVYKLFALAQSMPGILAVNMAMFLGYRLNKIKGAIAAGIGVMLPSILVITIIAAFFNRFADISWVQSIFRGLNIAVVVTIFQALWSMAKKSIYDIFTLIIFLFVLVAYLVTGFNPVIFTILGSIAGLLLAGRSNRHA